MKDFKLESNTKLNSGFTVPEGYFDSFSQLVLEQLPQSKPKVVSLFGKYQKWYYAAAAVVVLAISIPFIKSTDTTFEQVDPVTLENYLVNQSTVNEDEIVDVMANEDIEKIPIEYSISDKDIEETLESNPNIEQYLIN